MSDIVERLEACLDIPEVPSSVCRAISEAADLITSLRALVATPKPEATPIGYCVWISKNKLAACAKSARNSFPVYANPPKPETEVKGSEFCGCMAGPNDPDPECTECGGTGKATEGGAHVSDEQIRTYKVAYNRYFDDVLKGLIVPSGDISFEATRFALAALTNAKEGSDAL